MFWLAWQSLVWNLSNNLGSELHFERNRRDMKKRRRKRRRERGKAK